MDLPGRAIVLAAQIGVWQNYILYSGPRLRAGSKGNIKLRPVVGQFDSVGGGDIRGVGRVLVDDVQVRETERGARSRLFCSNRSQRHRPFPAESRPHRTTWPRVKITAVERLLGESLGRRQTGASAGQNGARSRRPDGRETCGPHSQTRPKQQRAFRHKITTKSITVAVFAGALQASSSERPRPAKNEQTLR
jgi:hypothetical protein